MKLMRLSCVSQETDATVQTADEESHVDIESHNL